MSVTGSGSDQVRRVFWSVGAMLVVLPAMLSAPARPAYAFSTANLNTLSQWSFNAGGLTKLQARTTVTVDPGTSAGYYFYATTSSLNSSDPVYIGLQNDGLEGRTGNVPVRVGKMAIFSMWNAQGADPGIFGWCVDVLEPNPDQGNQVQPIKSCRIRYSWVAGREYRTEIVRVGSTSLWDGYVIDTVTGARTLIGRMAGRSTLLKAYAVNFLERSGPNFPNCGGLPLTSVTFPPPVGNDTVVGRSVVDTVGTGACSADRSLTSTFSGKVHRMGTTNWGCDFLYSGYALNRGGTVMSCNGRYLLVHQTDGNVVLYFLNIAGNPGSGTAVWATNTGGRSTTQLVMQKDGNLVLYGPTGWIWQTYTYGNPVGAFVKVQADGKLVMYRGDETGTLWASR